MKPAGTASDERGTEARRNRRLGCLDRRRRLALVWIDLGSDDFQEIRSLASQPVRRMLDAHFLK
jgi:hypothetical protein